MASHQPRRDTPTFEERKRDGRMSHVVFPILLGIALLVFAGIIAFRARLLLAARPAARLDRIPERIRRLVVDGLGQKKFLAGEQPSGIMHALIFWGFVVLMLQVVTLFGRALDANWDIPGFGADQPLGPPFFVARDLLEACVIVGVVYMLWRRVIVHTPRLFGLGRAERRYREETHWEGVLILVLILLIMVGGLLYDAGHLVAFDIHGNERDFAPLTALVAAALGGLSAPPRTRSARWAGGCTASRSWSSCACSRCPSTFTSSRRSPTCSSASCPPRDAQRPLAITQVPAAPVAALDAPPEGLVGDRVARRPELEAGARRVLVHGMRALHGGLPGDGERLAAGAAAADPRPPRSPVPRRGGAADGDEPSR